MRAYLFLLTATGLPIAVSLVLAPLITASISTLEYGSYVNYLTLLGATNILVGFASAGYISNAYIHPQSSDQIVSSMFSFMLLSIAPAAAVAAVVTYLSADLPMMTVTVALVSTGVCAYITTSFQSFAILRRQYGLLLLVALSQIIAQIVVVGILILSSSVSLGGLILGNLAGSALACACAIVLWRRLGFRFVRPRCESLQKILLYAIPLVPHMLLSLASGSFDRWYLVGAEKLDDLAVYAVASSVAGMVLILLDMGNKVYSPSVFEKLKTSNRIVRSYLVRAGFFVALSLAAGVAVAAAGYWFVLHAFHRDYAKAAWLCVSLALASSCYSIYFAASPFLYFFNKTGYVFSSSLAGAVATIAFSMLLYEPLQLYGLVAGRLIGFLVSGLVALGFACHLITENHVSPGGISR